MIADGRGKGEPGKIQAGVPGEGRGVRQLRRLARDVSGSIHMDTGNVPFLVPPYRCLRTDGILLFMG